ncbi:TPA: tetraacyldisaccharide 4'-kinase, partial [Haemophilus influenzae]
AVKCQSFANDNWWYVPVDAEIIEAEKQSENLPLFWAKIDKLVEQYRNG